MKSFKNFIYENNDEARFGSASDPRNFGLPQIPGMQRAGGDYFDNSDVIWHHTNLLRHAIKNNNMEKIALHSAKITAAGGNIEEIMKELSTPPSENPSEK